MTLLTKAQAGTLESSDLMVLIKPLPEGNGRVIEINSSVQVQYGDTISKTINDILDQFDIADVHLNINDKGALTPVIKARIETAIKRSAGIAQGTLTE